MARTFNFYPSGRQITALTAGVQIGAAGSPVVVSYTLTDVSSSRQQAANATYWAPQPENADDAIQSLISEEAQAFAASCAIADALKALNY